MVRHHWDNKNLVNENVIYETVIDGEIKVVKIIKDFR